MILGNSFMVGHRAVLDYSNFPASLCRHGRLYTLRPRSILTDKGKLPVLAPVSEVTEPSCSLKPLPPEDKAARRANHADSNAKYTDCLQGLDPKLLLSCASARKYIRHVCTGLLFLLGFGYSGRYCSG